MEAVEPSDTFILLMGYEVDKEILEGYRDVMLTSPRNKQCERWGTFQKSVDEIQETNSYEEQSSKPLNLSKSF